MKIQNKKYIAVEFGDSGYSEGLFTMIRPGDVWIQSTKKKKI